MQGNRVELNEADQELLSFNACADVVVKNNIVLNHQNTFKIDFFNSPPRTQIPQTKDWFVNMADE